MTAAAPVVPILSDPIGFLNYAVGADSLDESGLERRAQKEIEARAAYYKAEDALVAAQATRSELQSDAASVNSQIADITKRLSDLTPRMAAEVKKKRGGILESLLAEQSGLRARRDALLAILTYVTEVQLVDAERAIRARKLDVLNAQIKWTIAEGVRASAGFLKLHENTFRSRDIAPTLQPSAPPVVFSKKLAELLKERDSLQGVNV
jgi:hypothetical protein